MRNAPSMLPTLAGTLYRPAFLVTITFRSSTVYAWSGVGNLVYNGNTYLGVGSFGDVSSVTEGTEVKADGMILTLSGIDPALLNDSLTDIKIGAPAQVLFAVLDQNMRVIGTPYPLFVGQVDKPTIQTSTDTISISLALETKMYNLQRATQRKYTSADQRIYYPDDTGFSWVESLSDLALKWGH